MTAADKIRALRIYLMTDGDNICEDDKVRDALANVIEAAEDCLHRCGGSKLDAALARLDEALP